MLNKILSGIKQDNNKETFEAAELAKLYHNVIHSARVGIAIIHGKDMVVSTVNEACLEIWGADKSVIGQSLYHSLPDLMAQAAHILEEIYDTGKPFVGNEIPYVVNRNGEKTINKLTTVATFLPYIFFTKSPINNIDTAKKIMLKALRLIILKSNILPHIFKIM